MDHPSPDQRRPAPVAGLAAAVLLLHHGALPAPAAEPPKPSAFQQQRELLRRLSQQQQLRLQQQQLCIDKAGNAAELDRCSTTDAPAWHHGMGMGGRGCSPW